MGSCPGDCPHVYLLACRAAMPLKPDMAAHVQSPGAHAMCCVFKANLKALTDMNHSQYCVLKYK